MVSEIKVEAVGRECRSGTWEILSKQDVVVDWIM